MPRILLMLLCAAVLGSVPSVADDTTQTPKRLSVKIPVEMDYFPETGHDSWTETYNNPEFYEWLLAQKRKPVTE